MLASGGVDKVVYILDMEHGSEAARGEVVNPVNTLAFTLCLFEVLMYYGLFRELCSANLIGRERVLRFAQLSVASAVTAGTKGNTLYHPMEQVSCILM